MSASEAVYLGVGQGVQLVWEGTQVLLRKPVCVGVDQEVCGYAKAPEGGPLCSEMSFSEEMNLP